MNKILCVEKTMDKEQLHQLNTLMKAIPLFGKKVGLHNIEMIIALMNDTLPISSYLESVHVIHVTGTNGKGSVCKMLSEIYDASGYKVGLFTSPHIDVITERVQINNENVSGELFYEAYQCVKSICDALIEKGVEPTFFEWMFSIALYCFCKKELDVLIIEVGIGGRLDTTNVLPQKDLSVITSIGLDHQDILGETLLDIAKEKVGILPKKGRLVIGNIDKEAEAVIRQIAVKKEAILCKIQPNDYKIIDFTDKSIDFSVHNKYYNYECLRLNTCARYQLENASISLMCVYALRYIIPVKKEEVVLGFNQFFWPGRLERIHERIYIDGAHNVLGMTTLLQTLKAVFISEPLDLLLGMKQHKDYSTVIHLLMKSGLFKNIYLVDLSTGNGIEKDLLYSEVIKYTDTVYYIENLADFLRKRLREQGVSVLLATGSLFLTSDIRKIFQEEALHD